MPGINHWDPLWDTEHRAFPACGVYPQTMRDFIPPVRRASFIVPSDGQVQVDTFSLQERAENKRNCRRIRAFHPQVRPLTLHIDLYTDVLRKRSAAARQLQPLTHKRHAVQQQNQQKQYRSSTKM